MRARARIRAASARKARALSAPSNQPTWQVKAAADFCRVYDDGRRPAATAAAAATVAAAAAIAIVRPLSSALAPLTRKWPLTYMRARASSEQNAPRIEISRSRSRLFSRRAERSALTRLATGAIESHGRQPLARAHELIDRAGQSAISLRHADNMRARRTSR